MNATILALLNTNFPDWMWDDRVFMLHAFDDFYLDYAGRLGGSRIIQLRQILCYRHQDIVNQTVT